MVVINLFVPLMILRAYCQAPIFVFQGCHNEYHRLGGLNNRNLLSYGFGSQKSMVKMLVGLISSVVSLLGLQTVTFSLGPDMVSPQCMHPWCLSMCPNLFFLGPQSNWIRKPSPQWPPFDLIIPLKAKIQLHSEVNLGGHNSAHSLPFIFCYKPASSTFPLIL